MVFVAFEFLHFKPVDEFIEFFLVTYDAIVMMWDQTIWLHSANIAQELHLFLCV